MRGGGRGSAWYGWDAEAGSREGGSVPSSPCLAGQVLASQAGEVAQRRRALAQQAPGPRCKAFSTSAPAAKVGKATIAGVSKQSIRERIWDYMESHDIADFPRPVHHRIPNFKGSYLAGQSIRDLEVFAGTQEVKVDPDKPLEGVRFLALQSKKTLLVPTPRLRTGLFNKITPPPGATKDILRKCATSQGVRNFSVPVGLDSSVLVDLVVVGSVAVSEKGWRIGKGEGYADLEYAMMVSMGAVHKGTPVVTIVHDCQVVDIPEALVEDHDLTVDYILTPTRVITTGCARPKPTGIMWSKVSCEMLTKIPVLRNLREREKQAGKDVTLRDEPGSQQPAPGPIRRPQDRPQTGPTSGCQRLEGVTGAAEGYVTWTQPWKTANSVTSASKLSEVP